MNRSIQQQQKPSPLPVSKLIIKGDGDCLYNAIIQGLAKHPCGNMTDFAKVALNAGQMRRNIAMVGRDLDDCYKNLYEILASMSEEDIKKTALDPGSRDTFPPWALSWFLNTKKADRSWRSFVAEGGRRVKATSEYATECEIGILKERLLDNKVIMNIIKVRRTEALPPVAYFGTCDNPVINLLYNGVDHYDVLIPAYKAGTRKNRRSKRKTRRNRRR